MKYFFIISLFFIHIYAKAKSGEKFSTYTHIFHDYRSDNVFLRIRKTKSLNSKNSEFTAVGKKEWKIIEYNKLNKELSSIYFKMKKFDKAYSGNGENVVQSSKDNTITDDPNNEFADIVFPYAKDAYIIKVFFKDQLKISALINE